MAAEGGEKSGGGGVGGGEGGGNGGGGERLKLFVGQVPKHMTEEQLLAMFKEVALVDEVNIIKDRVTKASRGCCFVICPSRQEADKTVNVCHNKRTLPGASSPLQVKYADGELERLERKLFIGMLPKNVSDAEVTTLFSKYGNIKDLQILRGSPQTSKGCAFLKYETKDQALAAIDALNGKHKMEGSNIPLVVKWADTEKERQARRAQKAQSQASSVSITNSMQQPSIYGALPMGYISPYNGFGYQAPGTYGLVPYPITSMQNQADYTGNAFRAMSHDLSMITRSRNFTTMQSAGYIGSGYLGSGYPSIPGLQYSLPYQGSMMSPRPNTSTQASITSTSSAGQIEGPPGANLFIYHIPQDYGDLELSNAFQRFGKVLSAKVFLDKATGLSKCFGFVSYDSPAAAQDAINVMNGFQLGGKKLKVQLKRENRTNLSDNLS
ncbi:RNA-binding protein BRN1-like [Phalaenopsis equestris]|uniref:RNA-binding protein BRN1-like n=1 Tax=Phalaenopsis equestris TaxID=78828 RepID=UPI0009E4204F|nr:RNA-binding protein BRN1-like [Phalaenopsis equestris]